VINFEKEFAGISPEVLAANVRIVADIEIDPVTQEVVSTPIADAMGWTYTRFGHQAKPSQTAALFIQEDGSIWQAKVFGLDGHGKRSGQYFAPKGIGDVPYLPTVPPAMACELALSHGLTRGLRRSGTKNRVKRPIRIAK
jgi:hypothetical protein